MVTEIRIPDINPQLPTTDDRRPMTAIKFGTDGWRAVIADDFTYENVRRVAGAIAAYVLKHEDPSHGLIVGYDTRFGSPDSRELRLKFWLPPEFRSSWPATILQLRRFRLQ